jgi:DNA-binding protein WhiA
LESFSSKIKKELSQTNNLKDKNLVKFELEGYLLTNNSNKIQTESEYNINRLSRLLSNLNENNFKIEIKGNNFCITINHFRELLEKYNIFEENIENEEEVKALARGVFLRSGSVNNPKSVYHLELIFDDLDNANLFIKILGDYGFIFKKSVRRNYIMIYLKKGESISDFLAFIGANQSMLQFENTRVLKEVRNKVNREVNYETANLNKIIKSSVKQIEDIKYIKSKRKFNKLSDKEQEIANLRLENPDKSLDQLRKMIIPEISKSGINHRLKSIQDFAEELRKEE